MFVKIAEGVLQTKFGEFHETLYYDGQKESISLVMGEIGEQEDVLCRVHSACISAHVFNSIECDCREQMEISQRLIQKAGKGMIIWLDHEGKANGHFALLKSIEQKRLGLTQTESYEAIGFKRDARDFTRAAEIVADLGVKSIRMLTNNPKKVETLKQRGVKVTGIEELVIDPADNKELRKTLEGKVKDGHNLNLD